MRYWDTSGLASLLLTDSHTASASALLRDDPGVTTWWATFVECHSSIWNNERRGLLDANEADTAQHRLAVLSKLWSEVPPSEAVRDLAVRLLRVHELRAADALQLAAAISAADGHTAKLPFVTNDRRLAAAARKEGFPVITSEDKSP